jgi:2-oxoglutarate dehydrogenase E1 component
MSERSLDDLADSLLAHAAFVDEMFAAWLSDPASVSADWAAVFATQPRPPAGAPRPASAPPPYLTSTGDLPPGVDPTLAPALQVYDLIHGYRQYGHLAADLDPLGNSERSHPLLDLSEFGLTEADLDRTVTCGGFPGMGAVTTAPVRDFLGALRETYSGPIGVEYVDVVDKAERDWLQGHMEPIRNRPRISTDTRRDLLRRLLAADTFEDQLHKMYVGAKRFSLEGSTTLITLLDEMLLTAAGAGRAIPIGTTRDVPPADQVVLGMAHRGRLNVLAHVLGKPLEYILAEFEGRPLAYDLEGYGDVKYHAGFSADWRAPNGHAIHLSLAFNPSHLEAVDPVVEGSVRARQDLLGDDRRTHVVPILIHGDAAFAGQGVVAETFTLANLAGYTTGGTIHIIVNNQVGFTTDPRDTRSTRYASDIAKVVRAPVFHVNADHPEAVALCAQLAIAYRQRFGKDVVVDLVCFRRHGHNEADDPSFTQPVMAARIKEHLPVSTIYARKLELAGVVTAGEVAAWEAELRSKLAAAREVARTVPEQLTQRLGGRWRGLKSSHEASRDADTRVPRDTLERIGRALVTVPDGFTWHHRLERLMRDRSTAIVDDRELDWGAGEALAFGSLLADGIPVRLSGQDVCRGTFSHRHAVYFDARTGAGWVPLDQVGDGRARLRVWNSPLSEEAVLGFEYGYATTDPWTLTLWEAQFGDFVNSAQVVIDQYLSSGELKWGRMNGLVLLLPHGLEGQGPEHSSARLERFLELCAEDNMQVVYPTTPAQMFHVLRRQMVREFRKPLVVMTPKSLLRHPAAVSRLADLTDGGFDEAIDDGSGIDRSAVTRVLLCSGKVYYALAEARARRTARDVAIVRIEQLYPYPLGRVQAILAGYPALREVVWTQEEPRNMGGWRHLRHNLERSLPPGVDLDYAGRDSRAVPATGLNEFHRREEEQLVDLALSTDRVPRLVRRRVGYPDARQIVR